MCSSDLGRQVRRPGEESRTRKRRGDARESVRASRKNFGERCRRADSAVLVRARCTDATLDQTHGCVHRARTIRTLANSTVTQNPKGPLRETLRVFELWYNAVNQIDGTENGFGGVDQWHGLSKIVWATKSP